MRTGIHFASYSEASAFIDLLDEEGLRSFLLRFGCDYLADHRRAAHSIVLDAYKDVFVSSEIVRTGKPTMFDRDARALDAVKSFIDLIEADTSGYAFERDAYRVTCLVTISKRVASFAAKLSKAEDLWSLHRALNFNNPYYFIEDHADEVADRLKEALEAHSVPDLGLEAHRYASDSHDFFMSVAEFEQFVDRETPKRRAISRARDEFHQRFGQACGPFDALRAEQTFEEHRHARYYDVKSTPAVSPARKVSPAEAAATFHPVSKGSRDAYLAFAKKELDLGFSPYGYWFSPEGKTFAMSSFQNHVAWLAHHLGMSTGLVRKYALGQGWVSMTMAEDLSTGANIAYLATPDAHKALRAAARIVRRGGDFTHVFIEAHDDRGEPIEHQFYEEPKAAVRRLNELSRELSKLEPGQPSGFGM